MTTQAIDQAKAELERAVLEDFAFKLRCRMLVIDLPEGEPVIHTFDRCVEREIEERFGAST
jgi:hypothetical protein